MRPLGTSGCGVGVLCNAAAAAAASAAASARARARSLACPQLNVFDAASIKKLAQASLDKAASLSSVDDMVMGLQEALKESGLLADKARPHTAARLLCHYSRSADVYRGPRTASVARPIHPLRFRFRACAGREPARAYPVLHAPWAPARPSPHAALPPRQPTGCAGCAASWPTNSASSVRDACL